MSENNPKLGVLGRNPKAGLDYKLPAMSAAHLSDLATVDELDWDTGFLVPDLPDEDQGGSGSCTEQGFCYHCKANLDIDLSRNDGYSNIGLPNQSGAMANDPYDNFNLRGQHTRINSPDPKPQTEANMKAKVNIDKVRYGVDEKMKVRYWSPSDLAIDTIARMIKTYNGMTGCFDITWEGWADRAFPRAPIRTDKDWAGSHMLWLRGFKKIDGQKRIIAKRSWKCPHSQNTHNFGEDYFNINSPYTFGIYASEFRKVLDMTVENVVIEYNGKLGVGIFDGGFVEVLAWAKDKQQILDLCKTYNVIPVGYDTNGYPLPTHSIKKIR